MSLFVLSRHAIDFYANGTHYPSLEQKHALLDRLRAAGVEYHMTNLNAWFTNRRKKQSPTLSSRDLCESDSLFKFDEQRSLYATHCHSVALDHSRKGEEDPNSFT